MTGTKLKIRIYGDPCLRKKSQKVREVGPAERLLINSMVETMHENNGIGLAAPQVGINQQIFVLDIGDGPEAVINPRVIKKWGGIKMEEGCLSIPGVVVTVKRPEEILVQYMDENNKMVERECADLLARVILHETDHLNGKLIVDYAGLRQKLKLRAQLDELTRQSKGIKS